MNTCGSRVHMKASLRGKSPGWAAFDLKQRQKHLVLHECDQEPYPPLLSTIRSLPRRGNLDTHELSAVTPSQPTVNFSMATENVMCDILQPLGDSGGSKIIGESNVQFFIKKLQELHIWADTSLVEDAMAAVDYDFNKASTHLNEMAPVNIDSISSHKDKLRDQGKKKRHPSRQQNVQLSEIAVNSIDSNPNEETRDEFLTCLESPYEDAAASVDHIGKILSSLPAEPELEDEDLYLIHRKTALKATRSASRHSSAAANAFLRGDHSSAHRHSEIAREEWSTADRLHAKAAKKILSSRNCQNDMWKLDLHGLHASEAIGALQEHLQELETQLSIYYNPSSLQVIIGLGKHSRGTAALPAAVKNFLCSNGYYFDEARPGVILVRPKFRRLGSCP